MPTLIATFEGKVPFLESPDPIFPDLHYYCACDASQRRAWYSCPTKQCQTDSTAREVHIAWD